jgi:RecA-family ATPase
MNTREALALHLAKQGMRIFPCEAGLKVPRKGFLWRRDATTDIKIIMQWFKDTPDMNYGVNPGEHGVVIDVDYKPKDNIDGRPIWEEIQRENGFIESFTVKSPGQGYHVYLTCYEPFSNANNFPKGIDVRSVGGYVVGPGSFAEDAHYELVKGNTTKIAEAPAWLIDEYLKPVGFKDPLHDVPEVEWDLPCNIALGEELLKTYEPAKEGHNGNDRTYELLQWFRDFGISIENALKTITESKWNASCEPPWGYDELEPLAEHAYRYGQNRPGSKADIIGMFEAEMDDLGFDEYVTPEEDQQPREEGPPEKPHNLYFGKEFTGRGMRMSYIIPGWLPSHGFTALNAPRGTGKSAIMLDLALRMASGKDWYDIPFSKKEYVPVYLCGEDDEGLELNFIAWEAEHGEVPSENIVIADGITNLMKAEDVKTWMEEIREKVDNRRCIIILDTWQRASFAAAQNKDEDMQKCVYNAEALAHALGGPLIVAFHPPKDGRQTILGSSIIENSSTAIWQVQEIDGCVKMWVSRIKGYGRGNEIKFKISQRELDEKDEFGNNRVGIYLTKVGGTEGVHGISTDDDEALYRRAWCDLFKQALLRDQIGLTVNASALSDKLAKCFSDKDFRELNKALCDNYGIQLKYSSETIKNKISALFKGEHNTSGEIHYDDDFVDFIWYKDGEGKSAQFRFKLKDSVIPF